MVINALLAWLHPTASDQRGDYKPLYHHYARLPFARLLVAIIVMKA